MRFILAAAALAALAGTITPGDTARAATRPVVVELFTSQGCSSCPPADDFLRELSATRADVLPLAFHVTYWNSLGWRDPFSLELGTERQRLYAAQLGLRQIYTPQMVIDGRFDAVGSDRPSVGDAIARAAAEDETIPVTVSRDGAGIVTEVAPGSAFGVVFLVGYDRRHETAIGRGENGGRTLVEANIVRSFQSIGRYDGAALKLRHALPAGEAAAVLLQRPDGAIVGAARLE
ncbi:DUF1223 domain-containing protein [Zavarzinia sp.]|uniref:DUF1223 domain-containing protein n=1 Tax=Zavarzinia sp. TaxID=2027920 RepID=UPI003568607B